MLRRSNADLMIFALLAVLMLVTRPQPMDQFVHLPDTAWASFFVMGYAMRARWSFAALFALAFAIDVVTIYGLRGSDYCFTPAYAMLVPAYGAMWMAGRLARRVLPVRAANIPAFALLICGAALVAHLCSSGGFYFLGGRFEQPTLAQFWVRVQTYFPGNLFAVLMWTGIAGLAHALVRIVRPDDALVVRERA